MCLRATLSKRCEEPPQRLLHLLASSARGATPCHQEDKPGRGDGTERRHGPFCGARREYQLEERDGVAKTFLQSTQRTISLVGSDEDAFADQRGCSHA